MLESVNFYYHDNVHRCRVNKNALNSKRKSMHSCHMLLLMMKKRKDALAKDFGMNLIDIAMIRAVNTGTAHA